MMESTDKLRYYNFFKTVPDEAKRTISGGRLKGLTDINPMWRIKMLTDMFGPVGKGWNVKQTGREFVPGANGEIVVIVDVALRYNDGGWSEEIHGTGGAKYVAEERGGLYTDDEAIKKAYTDAISVACKALGIGADVYFAGGDGKYGKALLCPECGQKIRSVKDWPPEKILERYGRCYECEAAARALNNGDSNGEDHQY